MRINHNVPGMNSSRTLGYSRSERVKSLEKMSSGFRVNCAADDAAGLAISEKLRAQITGANASVKNAYDDISLVHTAEGALAETHSMLNRLTELSVQAANGTYTKSERADVQKEVDKLMEEIDRVASATNFNGKTLIDGSLMATCDAVCNPVDTLAYGPVITDVKKLDPNNSYTGTAHIVRAGDKSATSADDPNKVNLNSYSDPYSLPDGDYELVVTKVSTFWKSATVELRCNGKPMQEISVVNYLADTSNNLPIADGITFDAKREDGKDYKKNDIIGTFSLRTAREDSTTISWVDQNGRPFPASEMDQAIAYRFDKNAKDGATIHIDNIQDNSITFFIDTESKKNITFSIMNCSSEMIGIAGLNVMTEEKAGEAVDAINTAVDVISTVRSGLGAVENRLEHTISALKNFSVNATAAESRIRDVDMAEEHAKFMKADIITQAAQSVLAQASKQPEGILSLLQQ